MRSLCACAISMKNSCRDIRDGTAFAVESRAAVAIRYHCRVKASHKCVSL